MADEPNGWDYTEPDWSVRTPAGGGRIRPPGGLSGLLLLVVVVLIAWAAVSSSPPAGAEPYREPAPCATVWPPTCDQEPAGP